MRRPAALALLALVVCQQALAADPAPPSVSTRLLPPPLMVAVDEGGLASRLGVTRVSVVARVVGHLAETRMTLTFGNTYPRALAADLYVPLPPEATVSGYALDVGGRLVDGVVVEKDEARRIFETEVRKGVDPGLVEWTRGNVFKTRVFPVPPQGSRTVAITWVAPLEQRGADSVYHLPLAFADKLAEAHVRVEVAHGSGPARLEADAGLGLRFDPRQVAEATSRDSALTRDLRVVLPGWSGGVPGAGESERVALVERSVLDGGLWFSLRDAVAPPGAGQPGVPLPAALAPLRPRRVGLWWDASLSRASADHAREIRLVTGWLEGLGEVEVALTVFRNVADPVVTYRLPAGLPALRAALGGLLHDGGTQLSAIHAQRDAHRCDAHVVVTDGLSTLGAETLPELGAPTWVLNSAPLSASAALAALAARHGGAFLELPRLQDEEVRAALGRPGWTLLGVEVLRGEVADLLPDGPVSGLGAVHVAGRLLGDEATLRLRWGVPGAPEVVSRTHVVRRPPEVPNGETLRFAWAQAKLSTLMAQPERNAEALVALGRAHRIVTPGTSLLVLETLEQYLAHDVEPPVTWPELRNAWQEARKTAEVAARADQEARLDEVAARWSQELTWYDTPFKPYARVEKAARRPGGNTLGSPLGRMGELSAGGGAVGPGGPRSLGASSPRAEADEEPTERFSAAAPAPAPASAPQAKKSAEAESQGVSAEIAIAAWDPDVPWLTPLKAARGPLDPVYLALRETHGRTPAFYLDVAEFFLARKDQARGLRILSNLAELRLDEPALLRVLGHRLAQLGELDLAIGVFSQVKRLRPEEPQSYRDLALVLGRRALERRTHSEDLPAALSLLAEVIKLRWDRFDGIEIVALHEFNRLVSLGASPADAPLPLDPRFVRPTPMDLRISMGWDTDLTDMDLHVVEPSGEEAYYGHPETQIGGRVSRDFTQGYGPETYGIRRAMKGRYRVRTHYFGSRAVALTGGVTLQLDLVTHWGRPNESRRAITLRLTEAREDFLVGEITF
jgi:Ca-activated chloride channel family protein